MTNEEFLRSVSLDGEIWKDVVGYEGLYVVSNMGRFASLERISMSRKGWSRITSARLLKTQRLVKTMHQTVFLCKDGKPKNFSCHRLVAETFIPNPSNLPEVEHLDCDPSNNKVDNLRWATHLSNMNNPLTKKKMSESGKKKNMSRLWKSVVCIKPDNSIQIYKSMTEAERDGFSHTLIHRVCNGISQLHRKCRWMYLSDYENLNTNDVKEL